MTNIVILGAGIGGINAANLLRKRLPSDCRITLIEKAPIHQFAPSFIWLMTGTRKPEEIITDTTNLIHSGVNLVISEVKKIETKSKKVYISDGIFNYDYLIIALGADSVPELIEGYNADVNNFYSLEGSLKLYNELNKFEKGSIAVVICSLPYKCPGAPYEGTLLIEDYLRKKGVRKNVNINIYTPEPHPLPSAGPVLGSSVIALLTSKNINFHSLHKMKFINREKNEIIYENGEKAGYDLLVVIPPHKSPSVVAESGLVNESGWIPVNYKTLETKFGNVFAIGDVTTIQTPGRWKPDVPMSLPKAGVFAHSQSETVAQIISDRIAGIPSDSTFDGVGYCMIESGGDKAGFAFGNFYGEPNPSIRMFSVGRIWHWGKVLFEKWWLASGLKKKLIKLLMKIGIKLFRLPIKI